MRPSPNLFVLIQSLTAKEKAFIRRELSHNSNSNDWSLSLFDFLVEQEEFDNKKLVAHYPNKSSAAISNGKSRLFSRISQILVEKRRRLDGANQIRLLAEKLEEIVLFRNRGLVEPALKQIDIALDIAKGIDAFEEIIRLLSIKGDILPEIIGGTDLQVELEGIAQNKRKYYSILENLLEYQRLEIRIDSAPPSFTDSPQTKVLLASIKADELLEENRPLSRKAHVIRFHLLRWIAKTSRDLETWALILQEIISFFEDNESLLADSTIFFDYLEVIYEQGIVRSILGEYGNAKNALESLLKISGKSKSTLTKWFAWGKEKALSLHIKTRQKDKAQVVETVEEVLKKLPKMELISPRERVQLLYKSLEVLVILGRYKDALSISRQLAIEKSPIRRDLLEAAKVIELCVFYTTENDQIEAGLRRIVKELSPKTQQRFWFVLDFLRQSTFATIEDKMTLEKEFLKSLSGDGIEKIAMEYFDFEWWITSKIRNKTMWEIQ